MRPPSIVKFTRVVLLSLLIGIFTTFLSWEKTEAAAAAIGAGVGSGTLLGIQGVSIAIFLVLIWFIHAHGSPVAKWIYVVVAVLGLAGGLSGFGTSMSYGTLPAVLAALQIILLAISLWLLFRPDSKNWFSEGRSDPGTTR